MSLISRYLQGTSFRHQLSIVVAIGVTMLALLSSLVLSWQMDRRLQDNFRQQGERIATNLAKQSRLALVYHSSDNAAEAIHTTMAFPDVIGVEIRTPKNEAIASTVHGISNVALVSPSPQVLAARQALLTFDDDEAWHFVAPVFRRAEVVDSPFEMEQKQDELLGYVRVVQSKATLKRMSRDIFIVNLGVSLGFAFLLLFIIRAMARRLSRPLEQLALAMGRAERGETVGLAELSGPKDIGAMARAFNAMIEALQDRERQLQHSKDEALRFAQIKADFAATVSHEIRTPLNGVIGTLDMLKSSPMPQQQGQLVDLAWESSQYLLDLVNNILDFSRLEAGKLEPEHIEFDLQRLVTGVVHTLSAQAVQKGIELRWQLATEAAKKLIGDPTRLRQILINLAGNAIKFTDTGSVCVEVSRVANGSYRFEVRDTGIGIDAPLLGHIFDSFTQADASTTRRFGGSGLGLSISKQLVTLLGGWIDVESQLDAGSCFFFELPLEEAAAPLQGPLAPMEICPEAPCRVLVVEDNRTNQIIARGMLQMLGAEVGLADNGIAGVAAYQEKGWDLILMDCNMPKMDGYEATAAIRTLESASGRRIPILAMTANTLPADLSKCKAAGMDDHLTKPLTMEVLAEKLRLWLVPGSLPPAPAREAATEVTQSLNRKTLEKLREALGDAISDAIRPFLEDMPGYLETIDQAGTVGDSEALKRTAHAIKGAASNLGAEALSAVAKAIEEHATAGRTDAASPLIDVLHAEYNRVHPVLQAEISSTPATLFSSFDQNMPLVLIVDDDRSTRTTLFHALARANFRVSEAADGLEALHWLQSEVPDVILMDAMMPTMDGFTACAKIKAEPDWKDIPILMITALEDQRSVERAFAAGASDYIPKPIHLSVVNQRVRRIVEATRAERHVRHLAYCDVLTGLPNRRNFSDQLGRALRTSQAKGTHFAVLFLDLDRFKLVNDTLGHEVGDRLLCSAAARIKECIRASDCVSRQGGDEFAILLDDIGTPAAANNAAQKICRSLSQPFQVDDHELFITASIGISLFPNDGTDASTLLRHADTAMYRAKRTNARVRFYESEMDSAISEHVRLESELRHAIERDELVVFYQPVVEAASGKLIGMEALVRWEHPTRGLVSPADFIPVAEETGLILPIGELVLNKACIQAQSWRQSGEYDIYVAVNLSARQIEQGTVVDVVREALHASGLAPSGLVLEITESVLMENAQETVAPLEQLRALGVRLSIDDFGTGYSSFSYLRRFPTDTVKIDQSFVQDMHHDTDARAIVTGIIALAHSLRLKVVAEGVETEDQRNHLHELGCDYLQGYLISKPVPSDVFERVFLTT
ncbi:MAG TPA: EAL domain-containing protein [Rhodocyclaceae bacterium]|nr:EAL domain-containing protein [Rhodocyclaceae bacterium]